MNQCINNLNGLFREDIQFEVTFSAGDELQGLFDNVVTALLYFRLFEILIAPVKIRAGVGVGDWTVKMESPDYPHSKMDQHIITQGKQLIKCMVRNCRIFEFVQTIWMT